MNIKLSADYNVSENLNLRVFYEQMTSKYKSQQHSHYLRSEQVFLQHLHSEIPVADSKNDINLKVLQF
jgi:hypothetical protein